MKKITWRHLSRDFHESPGTFEFFGTRQQLRTHFPHKNIIYYAFRHFDFDWRLFARGKQNKLNQKKKKLIDLRILSVLRTFTPGFWRRWPLTSHLSTFFGYFYSPPPPPICSSSSPPRTDFRLSAMWIFSPTFYSPDIFLFLINKFFF